MLKPIKGRPGYFLDTATNQTIKIAEYREDDKYDTVLITSDGATAVLAGAEYILFRDVANKRPIDTNFSQQARLSAGEEMIIDKIGATVRNAAGNILPTPSDVKKVADNAHLRVEINQLLITEGPLIKYNSGYGLAGNTQETDQGIVSIGVPSTAAAAKLMRTQHVTQKYEILGRLKFYDRLWMSVTDGITEEDRMPILSVPVAVTCWLHGLLKSAVGK